MQVAMPTFSSHGEVSTSSTDQEPSVSSLGAAFQSGMLGEVRKVEMESTTGECDTTQEDLDCQPHGTGVCGRVCVCVCVCVYMCVCDCVILFVYSVSIHV